MDNSLEKGELSHLRHKLSCADLLKNDLMDEIKLLQDDNSKLTTKISELEKRLSKTQLLNSPSYRNDVSLNRSVSAGDIEAEFFDVSTKYEKLQEEMRKSKMMVRELEDNLYSVRKERDELERMHEQKDETVRSLREAIKNIETEFMENVDEKGVLTSKLADKEAVIESLRVHCNQLEEMQVVSKLGDERKSYGALLRNYCPNLSADTSHSFSMIEESNPVLDLGSEVIDIQLREAKASLEKAEESIRQYQDEKNKLEVKCQQVEEKAKLTEEDLLSKIQDSQSELEMLNQEKISTDMKNQKLIEDLQSTINILEIQLEAIKTESSTLANQLSDKCSELEATKAQLEKSEDQNAVMAAENKRISAALKSTEESVLTVQKEREDAINKCQLAEERADDAEKSAVIRIAEEAAQCKEIYERKIEQCRAKLITALENVEEDLRRCQEDRDNAKLLTEELLLKVEDCENKLEMLKQEKSQVDFQNQKLIEDLQTTVNSLEGQLEAIKIESSTLTVQLSDKSSQLETIMKQLENSEDQKSIMSEENKRIMVALKTSEESFLAAERGREDAISKCQSAEQRADQAAKDAVVRIAEEVAQCQKDYEEKINQYEIEMEKVLKNSEENLKECQEERDDFITKCHQQEELAKCMEKELRLKIQDCESDMELLKQEKSRLDSQNKNCIEHLQSRINSLECQLEALKTESSNLADQLSQKCCDLETVSKQLEKSADENAAISGEVERVCSALKTTEESVVALQTELDIERSKLQLAEQRADQAEKDAVIRIAREVAQCKEDYEEKTNEYRGEMEKVVQKVEEKTNEYRGEMEKVVQKVEENLKECQEERDDLIIKCQQQEDEAEIVEKQLLQQIQDFEVKFEQLQQEKSQMSSASQKCIEDLQATIISVQSELETSKAEKAQLIDQLSEKDKRLEATLTQLAVLKDQNATVSEEVQRVCSALKTTEESVAALQAELHTATIKLQLAEQRADQAEKDAVVRISEEVAQCKEDYEEKTNQYRGEMEKIVEKAEENLKECQEERDDLIIQCQQQQEQAKLIENELSSQIKDCEVKIEELQKEKSQMSSASQKCIEDLQATIISVQSELEASKAEESKLIDQLSEKGNKLEAALTQLEFLKDQNATISEEVQRVCSALKTTEESVVALQAELDTSKSKLQLAEQRADQAEKDAVIRIAAEVAQCKEDHEEKRNQYRGEMEKVLEKVEENLKECQEERDDLIIKCQQQEEQAKLTEDQLSSQIKDCEVKIEELQEEKSQMNSTNHKLMEDLQGTINSLECQLEALKTERSNLAHQLSGKSIDLEAITKQLEKSEDENAAIYEEIQRVSSILKTAEESVVAIQAELDTARSKLQFAEQRADQVEKDAVIRITKEVAQCKEDYEQKINQYQGEMEKVLKKTEENLKECQDQLSDKCNDLETITKQLEKSDDENAAISEEIQRVCSTLKTTEESVVALQAELDTSKSKLQLAEQRADQAEKDAVIRIAAEVEQCKEDHEEKIKQCRIEMEKAVGQAEENLRECQEERDDLKNKCQQQEDQAKLTEKQLLLKITDLETRLEDLMERKSQNQKLIQDLESTNSTLEGRLEAMKTESSTLTDHFSDKCNELEAVKNQLERLEEQNKRMSEESMQISAILKTTEESVLAIQKEREDAMNKCQLAEQRAEEAEKNAVIRIAAEVAQCKEIYEQKIEQYRAEMEKALEKAEEDVRKCEDEKAALEIKCQEAEEKIKLTETELLSKIQEWATEVEELKQEKLSLNMKNQKVTDDLQSTINSLQGQLQAIKVDNSTLTDQLNKKSYDLETIKKELQALKAQNASISQENQDINLALKNLEESSRLFQAERETAVHKWQLAEQKAINAEKNVDLRITKEMAQCKQNYAQKTEQYRASVQKVLEEEMDKVKKLKQLLSASTEERDELNKKYDELKSKHEDSLSSKSQLEEKGEKLKREIGQLRRDYLDSQHVIHLMEKTLNKQTERLQQLESNSDHKFLAPSGASSQNLNRRHQMSDSNLSTSNSRRESCSSIGSAHLPRRRSDESDDRRLSSVSIASTCSNTSSSSGKFKVVPNGSGCFFKCEDEDEFQFQETNLAALKHKRQIGSTKLPGLKDDTRSEEDRFSELYRRNTMVPLHLKSCYPSEYITCDDAEVDENKLKQLPGYTRSTSGPLVGRLKDLSTISLPVSLVFSPPRKLALSSRKPLGETSQF